MQFRVLGPLEVRREGRPIELRGSKRRALLAILVLHANEVVRSDRLIDELWGEHLPGNATAALHNHLSRLRKDLGVGGEVLVTKPWGYVLRTDPEAIDLERFERLVAEAKPLAAEQRTAKLAEALKLWRGPALADLAEEPALALEIPRLEELRLSALEQRIDADLELGGHEELVHELETQVGEHPLRERLRGQLILALYRSGRQAEALETYRETRRVLVEELGIEPSPELRELERAILRQDPSLASAPPPLEPMVADSPTSSWRWPRSPLVVAGLLVLAGGGAAAAVIATRGGNHEPEAAPPPRAARAGAAVTSSSRSTAKSKETTTSVHKRRPSSAVSHAKPSALAVHSTHTSGATIAVQPDPPPAKPKPPTKKQPSPPLRPFRIADDFADDTMDWTIWHSLTSGTGVTIHQAEGRLEVELQADGEPGGDWNSLSAHYGTQCRFPSDFDARVDFMLLDWPAGSGALAQLDAFFVNAGVARQSSAQWGENYASWVQPQNAGVPTADTTGSLRIRRVNGLVTTYVRHKGRWVSLATGRSTNSTVIGPQAQAQAADWAHVAVRVAFDNFVATARQVDCPLGSLPPRA